MSSDKGRGYAGRKVWDLPSPKRKIPNPPERRIEDCTRLAWSSSRRPARVARAHPSTLQAGLLAPGSSYSRRLPGASSPPVAFGRFRPQLQRRDRDGFAPSSLLPRGTCKYFYTTRFRHRIQDNSTTWPKTKALTSTPRAWATGAHLAWRRNQTRGSAK